MAHLDGVRPNLDMPQGQATEVLSACGPLDQCCYEHDLCLNSAAFELNPKRQCMRGKCDDDMVDCLSKVKNDPRTSVVDRTLAAIGEFIFQFHPNDKPDGGLTRGNAP